MLIFLPHISAETIWLAIGLIGQSMFFMRFFVQWIASERRKMCVIPHAFWYFSILGGIFLLAYAVYRQDPVFIIGQTLGLGIYFRNLWLMHSASAHDQPGHHVWQSPQKLS